VAEGLYIQQYQIGSMQVARSLGSAEFLRTFIREVAGSNPDGAFCFLKKNHLFFVSFSINLLFLFHLPQLELLFLLVLLHFLFDMI